MGTHVSESLLLANVRGIEIKAEIATALVMNIPIAQFNGVNLYSDFLHSDYSKKESWIAKALFLFSNLVQYDGSNDSEETSYELPNGVPLFCPVFETLFQEIDIRDSHQQEEHEDDEEMLQSERRGKIVKTPVGVRLWLFCFDKNYNLGDALLSAVKVNRMAKQQMRWEKGKTPGKASHLFFQTYTDNIQTYIYEIADQYLENQSNSDHKVLQQYFDASHPYQLEKIFSFYQATQRHCGDICQKQMLVESYFEGEGYTDESFVDFGTWKGFPFPDDVAYVPSIFFKPIHLYHHPTAWVLKKIIDPRVIRIVDPISAIDVQTFDELGMRDFPDLRNSDDRPVTTVILTNLAYLKTLVERKVSDSCAVTETEEEIFSRNNDVYRFKVLQRRTHSEFKLSYPLEAEYLIKQHSRKKCYELYSLIMTSNNLTPPMIAMRNWFQTYSRSNPVFGSFHMIWKNLTLYGNWRVFEQNLLDIIFDIHNNFNQFRAILLATLCGNSCPFESDTGGVLKPHMTVLGPPTSGKSFVMDAVENTYPPGVGRNRNSNTEFAYTGNTGDGSDGFIFTHEAKPSTLGATDRGTASKDANETTNSTKDRLSSGKLTRMSLVFNKATGERMMRENVMRHDTTNIFLGNFSVPTGTPMEERTLSILAEHKSRADKKVSDLNSALCEKQRKEERNFFRDVYRVWSSLYMIVDKFIECGILKDVNMLVFEFAFQRLINVLTELGLPIPSVRKKNQIALIARAQTIRYAIMKAFYSSLNKGFTVDSNGISKDFSPEMLFALEPFLVCTEEIVADVWTLFGHILFDSDLLEIANIIASESNAFPCDENTKFYRKIDSQTGLVVEDRRFISVVINDINELLPQISEKIKGVEKTSVFVKASIDRLKELKVNSKQYELVNDPTQSQSQSQTQGQSQGQSQTQSQSQTSSRSATQPGRATAANNQPLLANPQNRVIQIHPPASSDSNQPPPPPPPPPRVKQILKEIDGSTETRIPVAQVFRQDQRNPHILTLVIAVKFLELANQKLTLANILERVFSYRGQVPCMVPTSLPIQHPVHGTLYQFCRPVYFKETDEVQVIYNPNVRTELESNMKESYTAQNKPKINGAVFEANFVFDDPTKNIDYNVIVNELHSSFNGLPADLLPPQRMVDATLPANTSAIIKEMADPMDTMGYIYPDDLIKKFEEKLTKRDNDMKHKTGKALSHLLSTDGVPHSNPRLTPQIRYDRPPPPKRKEPEADEESEVTLLIPSKQRKIVSSESFPPPPSSPVSSDRDEEAGFSPARDQLNSQFHKLVLSVSNTNKE